MRLMMSGIMVGGPLDGRPIYMDLERSFLAVNYIDSITSEQVTGVYGWFDGAMLTVSYALPPAPMFRWQETKRQRNEGETQ